MQDNDGGAALEVAFGINADASFATLNTLDDVIGTVAADAVRQWQRVQASMGGGLKLAAATAEVTTFGNATNREMASAAAATSKAERSAEAMVRQLERQTSTFGKTSSEIRNMNVELRATEASSRGLTELATRLRAANAEMNRLEAGTGSLGAVAGKSRGTMTQLSFQINDVATMAAMGAKPMQIFASQAGQIYQIAQMAEGGVRGFGQQVAGLAVRFAPVIAGLAVASAGFALFNRWVNEGVKPEQLTSDLGKITGGADATKAELYKLKDATITWADTSSALFSVVGKDVAGLFVSDMKGMGKDVKSVLDDLTSYGRQSLAGLYAGVAGVKAYLGAVEKGGVLGIGKMLIGQGDPKLLEKTFGEQYDIADKYLTKLGGRVRTEAIKNARERNAKSIGFNNPAAPKVDKHADSLARDAAATEAQIRNLYKLATAYGESGAAALIAEARVKAESEALKKGAVVEAAVERQIRLSIAQRVSDAEKAAAAIGEQARVQTEVNALVANGNIPAAEAAGLVREMVAELPLLAALKVAEQKGYKTEIDKVNTALKHQREAQIAVKAAATGDFYAQANITGDKKLSDLREELRLVGATDDERIRSMATIKATRELEAAHQQLGTAYANEYVAKQVEIAVKTEGVAKAARMLNDELSFTADKWDLIANKVQSAGQGMADAFGSAGRAIGDLASIYAGYNADREHAEVEHAARMKAAKGNEKALARETQMFALKSSGAQIGAFGDMADAAKGFFKEGSSGYKAMATAEKVYRAAQFAMSLQAMVQSVLETTTRVAGATAQATADGAAGIAAQSKLPFPANIAAMAATGAALVAAGIAVFAGGGGGSSAAPVTNTGTGTVLGDRSAQSQSIKNAIDALKEVDLLTNSYSREMAASLKSIDSQIGGVAALVTRAGDVNADATVTQGFKANVIGSVLGSIPVLGGILKGLFGSTTTVTGNGLYAGPQSVGSIMSGGFDAKYYSDIQKKSKFLGITTGTKTSTQYSAADAGLTDQFALILKQFNTAIVAAAGPLGAATGAIQGQLNGFVLNLGKIDLKGLTGEEIQEKLGAVFGAAADDMAAAAFPGMQRFQQVGEGTFETLVRVASTVEAVTTSLDQLGLTARALGIDAKMGIAGQFESIGDLTSAADAYFESYYSKAEQDAAKQSQLAKMFASINLGMPDTIASFRALVEAQDLTSASGQAAYATLLQLAPAFADLKSAMDGAKSAADILTERQDLQRQLLELQGDTAAIRALDLAKLDASNRGLQQEIYAVQDAQAAASAAKALSDAWTSVGDSIMDEVKRIRGITDAANGGGFAVLQGRFNAATASARGGDQDAAKSLPALSQALLTAAAEQATSRQELARVQAQTAASLEATYGFVSALTKGGTSPGASTQAFTDAAASQPTAATAKTSETASAIENLRTEIAQLRADNNAGHAATASNTGRMSRTLDSVTMASGGDAISIMAAA